MEASDLLHSSMFTPNHALSNRSTLSGNPIVSDSTSSLLFGRNANSGFAAAVAAAVSNANVSSGSSVNTRNSVTNTMTTSVPQTSSSMCTVNNASAAIMNAFGLANSLQLPHNIWDNSILNAALSQYFDANNLRSSLQNASHSNVEQLRNIPVTAPTPLIVSSSPSSIPHSATNGPINLQSLSNHLKSSKEEPDGNCKKTSKRSEMRSSCPVKKLRISDSQSGLNGELSSYIEQNKSFPCPECHKTFATEVDLKAHLMRHVMQHPYSCSTCGKGFKYEHTLDFHMKSQHGQDAGTSPKLNLKNSAKKNALINGNRKNDSEERPAVARLLKASKQQWQQQQQQQQQQPQPQSKPQPQQLHHQNSFDLIETEDINNNQLFGMSIKNSKLKIQNGIINNNSVNHATSNNVGSDNNSMRTENSGQINMGGIQIKSEKVLIVQLEVFNPINEQTSLMYKCNTCGYSQSKLELVSEHVQNQHFNNTSGSPSLSCEKCGIIFKWQNELFIHEHLHKAIDQVSNSSFNNNSCGMVAPSGLNTSKSNSFKNLMIPPLLQSNLLLMNQYLNGNTFAASNSTNLPTLPNCVTDTPKLMNDNNLKKINLADQNTKNASESVCKSPNELSNDCLNSLDSNGKTDSNNFGACSPGGSSVAVLKELSGNGSQCTLDSDFMMDLNKLNKKDVENTNQESICPRRNNKLALKELRSDEIDELSKNIAVIKESTKSGLGEIEETAPGQFKCRFCEKTFDRIFSVHRHERVHTGFKPCVCKVCGRGFSEKRNLRHHIIRFHSDGSGRELLRRVRKDKSGSVENGEARRQLKEMESGLLESNEIHNDLRSNQDSEADLEDCGIGESIENSDMIADHDDEHRENSLNQASSSDLNALRDNSSSSRRRKSMPYKKMLINMNRETVSRQNSHSNEDDEEDEEEDMDEDIEEEEDDCMDANRLEEDDRTQDANDSDTQERSI